MPIDVSAKGPPRVSTDAAQRPGPQRHVTVSRNILAAIGDTPLLEIDGIFVKLEFLNPSGSIKARIAHYMIERAEQQGLLKPGDTIVRVDPRYYRPTEVETLLGDPTKAREKLGWTPKISLAELIHEMVAADYAEARRDALVKSAGFQTFNRHE